MPEQFEGMNGEIECREEGASGCGLTSEVLAGAEAASGLNSADGAAICRWKPDTTLTYVNARYCELFNKPAEELLGRKWLDLLPHETRASVAAFYERLAEAPEAATLEHEVIAGDGTIRSQEWTDIPIQDADGAALEFLSVGRDVTERRRRERALRESEAKYRCLVENAVHSVARVSTEGEFLLVNRAFCRFTGLRVLDVIGHGPEVLVPFLSAAEFAKMNEAVTRALAMETTTSVEVRFERAPGGPRWIWQVAYPWRKADGVLGGIEILGHDITKRKETEAALFRATDRLAQAGRFSAVSELCASACHELAQPLSAIDVYAANTVKLLDRDMLEEARGNLASMRDVLAEATRIVCDLRARGKTTAQVKAVRLPLDELLRNVLLLVDRGGRPDRIEVTLEMPKEELLVDCDRIRFEQIFMNLVTNAFDAVQGTAAPEVTIAAEREGDMAVVWVRDSGVGISDGDAEKIFEPFYSSKAAGCGLGLGLPIARRLIQAQGGTLHAHNRPGGGAEFEVRLPLSRHSAQSVS